VDAILLRWRDIPAQIIVRQGRKRARARLSGRFQNAIDRAAMRAKKRSADAYMDEWAREPLKLDAEDLAADLQAAADRLAARIETAYPDERLLTLIRNHGLADD
jgi:hypothetical protein